MKKKTTTKKKVAVAKKLGAGIPIEEKLMLVDLNIKFTSFRKRDKKVSDEIAQQYETDEDIGKFNKILIDKRIMKELRQSRNDIRDYHRRMTMPWGEGRYDRVILATTYLDYTQEIRKLISTYKEMADAFAAKYDVHKEASKKRLKKMFQEEDYPKASTVREKFGVRVYPRPISRAKDFRVQMAGEEADNIKKSIEEEITQGLAHAMKELWKKIYTPLSKMMETLSDDKAIFRDTLVGNIVEITQLIPKLNLTDDPEMNNIQKELESKICSLEPKELRKDKKYRKETVKEVKNILDKMAGYIQ